jgi:hypothetical protein
MSIPDDEIVDAGEIFLGIILDLDAAALFIAGDDANTRAKDTFELVDRRADVRVAIQSGGVGAPLERGRWGFLDRTFDLPDGHGPVGGFVRQGNLLLGGFEREKGAGVSHGQAVFGNKLLHFEGEPEEAQHVGDGGSVLAGALGDLLVGQAEFAVEALEGVGDFDGVEVFALDVFDKSDFHEAVVGDVLDNDGHVMKAGDAGGAKAAFTGDELIAVVRAPYDERLDDAVFANGLGEFLEALRGERGTGL